MRAFRKITAAVAILLLCQPCWAAKKGRAASPLPSISNVATEAESVSQNQKATRTTVAPEWSPATLKTSLNAVAVPDPELEQPQSPPSEARDAAAFAIPWQSVNGGGGPMSSANYSMNSSAGQSAIGFASSTSYQAGVGYWYGVGAATGCSCPFQCDYDTDGFLTALDLGALIDVLFAGKPEETDPGCSTSRGDFDCDGFPTALDLGGLIDHLFAGGAEPCDPCIL